jgi:hypothetical protein
LRIQHIGVDKDDLGRREQRFEIGGIAERVEMMRHHAEAAEDAPQRLMIAVLRHHQDGGRAAEILHRALDHLTTLRLADRAWRSCRTSSQIR